MFTVAGPTDNLSEASLEAALSTGEASPRPSSSPDSRDWPRRSLSDVVTDTPVVTNPGRAWPFRVWSRSVWTGCGGFVVSETTGPAANAGGQPLAGQMNTEGPSGESGGPRPSMGASRRILLPEQGRARTRAIVPAVEMALAEGREPLIRDLPDLGRIEARRGPGPLFLLLRFALQGMTWGPAREGWGRLAREHECASTFLASRNLSGPGRSATTRWSAIHPGT